MAGSGSAVHRTIVAVDVEAFGAADRSDRHRVVVRAGMYRALRGAFEQAGIPWQRCEQEGLGDGVFVLVPPDVIKAPFVEELPARLTSALRAHNRTHPPEERIRLRMVLHAGEVRYDEHGVTAAAINMAFRLLDAAALKVALRSSSGTLAVIVSSWFFDEVVRHSAVEKSSFRSVRIVHKETMTTGWISLPDDAAARTVAMRPRPAGDQFVMRRTLPRDTNVFTGRGEELARLLTAAERSEHAVVCLIDGMPGVGKTTLAVHVAHRLAPTFPDSQLFVPLHAHTPGHPDVDAFTALGSLLTSAGVDSRQLPTTIDDRAALWRDRLSGRRVLLVLDDAASVEQIEPLLPAQAECLTLVTSRRRLAPAEGDVALSLETLSSADGIALFTRLSRRPPGQEEPARELVRLAGGLPLAISLLAARLSQHPAWSVEDLVDDVRSARDRLAEIHVGGVEAAAALDSSYRNLPEDQRLLFRRIGLHPGLDLDAYSAAALADVPVPGARTGLRALYDEHLLLEPTRDGYRMHDLVREYSRSLSRASSTAENERAMDRLMAYYTDTAADASDLISEAVEPDIMFIPPPRPLGEGASHLHTTAQAWTWLRRERSNLIACLTHAADRAALHLVLGLTDAITTFLHFAATRDEERDVHKLARAAARRLGDERRVATALVNLGRALRGVGDYHAAASVLKEALAGQGLLNDFHRRMAALMELGVARRQVDDLAGASEAQAQALELARVNRNLRYEAHVLDDMGIVHWARGQLAEAIDAHTRALAIHEAVGDRRGQTDSRTELAVAYTTTGNVPEAVRLLTQSVHEYGEYGDRYLQAFALNSLGIALRLSGHIDEAINKHLTALSLSEAIGDRIGQAVGRNALGAAYRVAGRYEEAETLHREALRMYQAFGYRTGEAETLNLQATLLLATGATRTALEQYDRALAIARDSDARLEQARAMEGLGHCAAALSQLDTAHTYFQQALTIHEVAGATQAATELRNRLSAGNPNLTR